MSPSVHPCSRPTPTPWVEHLDAFDAHLRAAGRRDSTIQTRLRHLRQLARAFPDTEPEQVAADQLTAWAASMQWENETRHSYYVSIRAFYTHIGTTPSPAEALPPISRTIPPPHPTPEKTYRSSLALADDRTRAIILLAGAAGLRRSEIVQVNKRDLIDDLTGTSLLIHAKGGRNRLIPLTDELASLIRARCSTNEEGWAFPSQAGGHITPQWAYKLARQVLPHDWSLHSLRHRFATNAYAVERDILAVQRLLGHTSVATTQRYTAPPTDAMRAAVSAAA